MLGTAKAAPVTVSRRSGRYVMPRSAGGGAKDCARLGSAELEAYASPVGSCRPYPNVPAKSILVRGRSGLIR